MLYNPFRSGRNGRKISYRHANRYEAPLRSTSAKISARSGPFRPFQPVPACFGGNLVSAGTLFGLWFLVFLLCFESAGPKSNFFFSAFTPPLSSLKSDLSASPLCSDLSSSFKWRHHSRLQASSLQQFSSVQSSPASSRCPPFLPPPAVQSSPASSFAHCFRCLQSPAASNRYDIWFFLIFFYCYFFVCVNL